MSRHQRPSSCASAAASAPSPPVHREDEEDEVYIQRCTRERALLPTRRLVRMASGPGLSTHQTSSLLVAQYHLAVQQANYGWIGSVRREAEFCFGRAWINSNLPPRYAPRSDERPWSQDLRRPDSRSRRRSRSPRSHLKQPVSNKGASGRSRRRGRGRGRGQKSSKSFSQSESSQSRPRSRTVGCQTGSELLRRALEDNMQAAATSKEKNQDKGPLCPVPGCEVRTK